MSNTNDLYTAWKSYKITRQAAEADYAEALSRLEPYKGSAGYQIKAEQAAQTRAAAIQQGRADVYARMTKAVENASAALNNYVEPAPTEEQFRRLQVLRMRKSISKEELMEAERACGANPSCAAVINEMYREHGFARQCAPIPGKMSRADAEKWLGYANSGIRKAMDNDNNPYSMQSRLDKAENESDFIDHLVGGFHSGYTFEGFAGIINA